MSVLADFFSNELDHPVCELIRQALSSGRHAYLTFNVFNVRLDPDAGTATVEDVLDPERDETVELEEFRRMVERAAASQGG